MPAAKLEALLKANFDARCDQRGGGGTRASWQLAVQAEQQRGLVQMARRVLLLPRRCFSIPAPPRRRPVLLQLLRQQGALGALPPHALAD